MEDSIHPIHFSLIMEVSGLTVQPNLLASTTEEDRQSRTRNRCNGMGYESVALIPLRSGDKNLGLLQLNDKRKNMFLK